MSDAPIGKLLWKYSLPAVVGMLVMSLYNVIDRIFIGQWVGPEAIAGLAITFPVMNLSAAFGVLIGAGGSARIFDTFRFA
ncbi:MATE family efflux transporter [Duncaniella dubosii]|uniref:MATE family efflux transporter n=1 Tax=Duncaniella dubosii TaxID=2518971 RepID=UPI003F666384